MAIRSGVKIITLFVLATAASASAGSCQPGTYSSSGQDPCTQVSKLLAAFASAEYVFHSVPLALTRAVRYDLYNT
jgi:hypothetical protein